MGHLGRILQALFGRSRRYRVVGNSMSPALTHGDLVWADPKGFVNARPRIGQIVVARHPYRSNVWIIKRVMSAVEGDRLVLRGDNRRESTDSEIFGAVPASLVVGPVVFGFRREPLRLLRFGDGAF